MKRITYISRFAKPMTADELEKLGHAAAEKNRDLEWTPATLRSDRRKRTIAYVVYAAAVDLLALDDDWCRVVPRAHPPHPFSFTRDQG